MATFPILTKPKPGDTLYLYLAISQNVMSSVLVKEVKKAQQPIYYVIKVLFDVKTRYTLADQLTLAPAMTVRKLRQYFQLHPIVMLTDQPLRQILQEA